MAVPVREIPIDSTRRSSHSSEDLAEEIIRILGPGGALSTFTYGEVVQYFWV